MQRSEIVLTGILVALIMAGTAYQSYRGGPKTAEVRVLRSGSDAGVQDALARPGSWPSPSPSPSFPAAQPDRDAFTVRFIHFLNTAPALDLCQIPGVGKVTADRILLFRQKSGGFGSVEDLQKVDGIGPKKYEQICEYIRAHPQLIFPTAPAAPARIVPGYRPTWFAPVPRRKATPRGIAVISINRASQEDLMAVSGIGEVIAGQLLLERQRLGGFTSWKQVEKVSGIGESRLRLLQQRFSIP
jgi:competence ComEA-like helix-hairpin-helix protein